MKKIFITLVFSVVCLWGYGQPFTNISEGESGASVRATLNGVIDYLNDLGYDLEFSNDGLSWHYGWSAGDIYVRYSSDYGTSWSDEIFLWDGDKLNYFDTDTLVLSGDTITSFEFAAWDSLVYRDDHYLEWWDQGSALDSILISTQDKMIYRITLPVNGTLSGSASAATDLPIGWSLSVSGGDLQINHGLGRYSSAVNIRYNTSGSSYRQLRNFDNAYSGILDVDSNNLTIESISTFYTAYELRITIIFE